MISKLGDAYDVIVVGGSWAGLAAAIQLGRARRRVLVIDAGLPRNRFAHSSHGFLGQDGRAPMDILATFRKEVLAYPTVAIVSGKAESARQLEAGLFDVSVDDRTVSAKRLILATGVIDELPLLPGLAERWGKTVVHCPYCHGYEVSDQKLGILAIGEMSLHQAQLLPDWSDDVTFFSNGAIELTEDQIALLQRRGIKIEERRIVSLVGDAPSLAGTLLEDGAVLPIEALFVGSRTRMGSPLLEQLGCDFFDGQFGPVVRTDARQQTSVPGVFAGGDAAREPHTATFAVSAGVAAGISAHRSLVFPEETR